MPFGVVIEITEGPGQRLLAITLMFFLFFIRIIIKQKRDATCISFSY